MRTPARILNCPHRCVSTLWKLTPRLVPCHSTWHSDDGSPAADGQNWGVVHNSVLHGYRSAGTAGVARQALKVHAVSTVDKVDAAPPATKSGQKTAVVVGAGVGGLTMAGRLARAGFKVCFCRLLAPLRARQRWSGGRRGRGCAQWNHLRTLLTGPLALLPTGDAAREERHRRRPHAVVLPTGGP